MLEEAKLAIGNLGKNTKKILVFLAKSETLLKALFYLFWSISSFAREIPGISANKMQK